MAIAPRNAAELTKLFLNDTQLRRDLFNLITKVDDQVRNESQQILLAALRRGQIDLRLMEHKDMSKALKKYYEELELNSKYVKMA